MITNILLLLSALGLSTIAGYYSVIGMTAIFAAAWWPVVIMTGTLEFSKIIVASWLYKNWDRTPFLLKTYLTGSVVVLMFITSLGIFGFLSKAHIEQTSGLGNNQLFIAQIDQQIKVEQQRIEDSRKVVQQLDEAVNSIIAQSASASAQKANRGATIAQQAATLRQRQKADRDALNKSIDEANLKIRDLNNQKLKLDQEQLKLEVEVGPIKYIAEMVYGTNPDKDLLEKAVRYVIILIIFVFDPLAVLMIIAANMSFMQGSKESEMPSAPISPSEPAPTKTEDRMGYHAAVATQQANDQRHHVAWAQAVTSSAAYDVPNTYGHVERPAPVPESVMVTPEPVADAPVPAPTEAQTVPAEAQPVVDTVSISITDHLEFKADADPVVDPNPAPVANDTVSPAPSIKKSDDILQTIKQYHTVRLDDAKRTLR